MVKLLRRRDEPKTSKLYEVLGDFELPTIPGVLTTAIDQLSQPEADLRAVGATIEQDPALLARILGIVNSAVYAPRSPILGAEQAVMMLGTNHLESLLISIAAGAAVSRPVAGFDLRKFWDASAWRGATAGALARQFDRTRRTENFTGALLQDLAVPLLAQNVSGYMELLDRWRSGENTLSELERRRYGWTHAQVAGWVFEEWEFPEALAVAVAEHDAAENVDVAFPIVRLVSVLGRPSMGERAVPWLAERLDETFGLGTDDAKAIIEQASTEAVRIANSIR